MENLLSIRRVCATLLCLSLVFSTSVMAAAKAVLYGPSQAEAGALVTLHGVNFKADTSYTVKTLVGKQSSQELVTAASDGSLSYQLITATAGQYKLQVWDSRNRLLAESMVQVNPAGDSQ